MPFHAKICYLFHDVMDTLLPNFRWAPKENSFITLGMQQLQTPWEILFDLEQGQYQHQQQERYHLQQQE
jgi:hypothetical protein